jgi:hypothetical protein
VRVIADPPAEVVARALRSEAAPDGVRRALVLGEVYRIVPCYRCGVELPIGVTGACCEDDGRWSPYVRSNT